MKQFTKEQAIALAESGEWKDWSSDEKVRVQLYQEKLCIPFDEFHKAIEEVLGRPVYTHEFGLNWKGIVSEYEGKSPAPTFEEIVNLIPENKRIIIGI